MKVREKCCICGRLIDGYSHNAEPYKYGRCCTNCNLTTVLPARINKIMKKRK